MVKQGDQELKQTPSKAPFADALSALQLPAFKYRVQTRTVHFSFYFQLADLSRICVLVKVLLER